MRMCLLQLWVWSQSLQHPWLRMAVASRSMGLKRVVRRKRQRLMK
jgi:hypothetical protein